MTRISGFSPLLHEKLPVTYKILVESNLTVHPYVYQIILSGSRGLSGFPRKDSDIDLTLLVQTSMLEKDSNKEEALEQVLRTTIDNWRSSTKIDTAAVFDVRGCRLSCFSCKTRTTYNCLIGGVDCFGIYKIQKGFKGYVTGLGIEMEKVFPVLTIWKRDSKGHHDFA